MKEIVIERRFSKLKNYELEKNEFLKSTKIKAYYSVPFYGYGEENNPDFLNELKNIFGNKSKKDLKPFSDAVRDIFEEDIPKIIKNHDLKECVLVGVPRSKSVFVQEQLVFRKTITYAYPTIREKVPFCKLFDGSEWITRIKDTRTTHIRSKKYKNNGEMPYPGIAKETCEFDKRIKGKDIILIDDIYTKGVNIDEDCIQALLDLGAKSVIFYSVGYTKKEDTNK